MEIEIIIFLKLLFLNNVSLSFSIFDVCVCMYVKCINAKTQLTFTCSKSTIETLEKGAKYGQS